MHSWLPDAHSQAPAPVSGLMSGVLLAVALYAILRIQAVADIVLGPGLMRGLLLTAGLASLTVAAALILRQRDYKRMLAYSSIEHMGLIAVGAAVGGPLASAAVLLHVLGHGLAKATAVRRRRPDARGGGHDAGSTTSVACSSGGPGSPSRWSPGWPRCSGSPVRALLLGGRDRGGRVAGGSRRGDGCRPRAAARAVRRARPRDGVHGARGRDRSSADARSPGNGARAGHGAPADDPARDRPRGDGRAWACSGPGRQRARRVPPLRWRHDRAPGPPTARRELPSRRRDLREPSPTARRRSPARARRGPRRRSGFHVVYAFAHPQDVRTELVVRLPRADPSVPSLASISFSAGRFERAMHDHLRHRADGHPRPRRLVLHDHWPQDWFPMRRDAAATPGSDRTRGRSPSSPSRARGSTRSRSARCTPG